MIPAPGQTTQPRVPVMRRQIPISSGCKIQWELEWWKKLPAFQETPLKRPSWSLNANLTDWDSTAGQQLEGHSHIRGVGELNRNGASANQTSRSQAMAQSPLETIPHTEPQSVEEGCPTLEITSVEEALPHTIYSYLFYNIPCY